MDKSAGNKKSPAGSTRRAYSIFGGIINLAHQQQSPTPKSNVLSSSSSLAQGNVSAATAAAAAGVVGGGTSLDPQGSSANVYTVTVTNSENPDNTNQAKTFENRVPMKKQKGDQSTSTTSSLTPYTIGMNNNSVGGSSSGSSGGGGGANTGSAGGASSRIGPAPRTLSILTALNELAISDKIEPNPTCSQPTPPVSTGNNQTRANVSRSSNTGIGSVSGISKSNPIHSSCHYPPKRAIYSGNITHHHQQQKQQHHGTLHGSKTEQQVHEGPTATNMLMASSTSSALHEHHHYQQQYTSSKNVASGSARSLYSTSKTGGGIGVVSPNSIGNSNNNVRLTKGYNEQLEAPPPPLPTYENTSAGKFPFSHAAATTTNTLPAVLRQTGSKSHGSHKESSARKGAAAKQRDRSKSQTPDWIWKIFQLTKHGKLEELKQSLLGLDPTLIRHLADAKGNTLLHSAVRGGHVNILQWLVSVLGSQCTEAALNDHNQARRTVILTALKKGQLQCLQWLVQNTKCGEKALVPNEGERSLLHHAAAQGTHLNVVRWLCTELIDKGISVDIRDAGGMTPLHVAAAKSGKLFLCHELILAGADPLSQTELGWRPSDLAIRHRHTECASYLMAAEAAGSLGNQLYSLLLAFNHLRQEHEELRSHFRETLRVGKWLAKERNDLIKQFPSKWTLDSGASSPTAANSGSGGGSNATSVSSPPPAVLLGGTSNGTRFSDLEHKLVLAEQAWRKISQNSDETSSESILNGEESSLSNVSSHEFLQRRLAAVQLRQERNQTLGNSRLSSGSSDEDPYQDSNNSSSDASSSDVDVERITSVTAGSHGGGGGERMMTVGQNSSAIIHSSNVSPSQKCSIGTMRTRSTSASTSKAAPWLLPPNDAFLSQLSPFVGAHVEKSLPTLDLLHGAPTSPTLLSPIVTPSSLSTAAAAAAASSTTTAAAIAPTITTDAAGKNEKSLVQMDTEHHGGNHAGKRDSTSLEISVLEVIEPTSHASPASSSFKKNFTQTPDLICGMQYKKRHGHQIPQQLLHQSLSLRERRPRKGCYYSHSEENLVGSHLEVEGIYEPVSPCFGDKSVSATHYTEPVVGKGLRNSSLHESVNALDTIAKGESSARKDSIVSFPSSSQSSRNKGGNEGLLPRPSSSFSIPLSTRRKKSGGDNEQQQQSRKLADDSHERSCDNEICYSRTGKVNFSPCSASTFGVNGSLHSGVTTHSGSEHATSSSNNSATRNISSKSQTPSPKSYVTKLTVIPVEAATETCFLSIRSRSFVQEQEQHEQHEEQDQTDVTGIGSSDVTVGMVEVHQEGLEDAHQLHLPGYNPSDELSSLGFPCQIPSYSVSSSNTPVMPRFNSSGTVVFPLRKPSSDWHSTELLSLTTPDSSLAGRLSPTPSETSRTESVLAPPSSYVSHASQNSEVSKTESSRGHPYHPHTMHEVSAEERDLESPVGGDGALHLQSSFINHTAGNTDSPFQSSHPETGSPSSQSNNRSSAVDTLAQKIALGAESMNSGMVVLDSFETCKSDRKKNRDCSTFTGSPTSNKDVDNDKPKQEVEATDTAAYSFTSVHDVVDEDDGGDHAGDNDRSAVKQRGLFEKQQQNKRIPVSATTSTARSIRSHLSTTSIHKVRALQQQQQQRLPKGHHHNRGQSKPWYEIEGSDDEGSLLRVAKSRSSHSSNFSSSINPVHGGGGGSSSSSNSPGSSTPVTSNPEESSSQNESAAEENQNNNGGAGGSRRTEAEQKDGDDGVQKVEQSGGSGTNGGHSHGHSNSSSNSSSGREGAQQQISSTTVTSNKKHNCSNFL